MHNVKIDEYDVYKYNNYTVSIYGDTYGNQTGVWQVIILKVIDINNNIKCIETFDSYLITLY